eukprot:COSAG02_NODE_27498_length_608_cov_0.901768_2_plen_44_part_01
MSMRTLGGVDIVSTGDASASVKNAAMHSVEDSRVGVQGMVYATV